MNKNERIWEDVKFFLSIIVCIACVLCSVHFFTSQEVADAYSDAQETAQEVAVNDRFFWADRYNGIAHIIVDRETGVCYLWKTAGGKGGLTVLVDSAGNPVIWEE